MVRESHMTTVAPTAIGTSKITGEYVHLGDSFTNGDVTEPKTIAESKYPIRYNGIKMVVRFPKTYTGTMTIELKTKPEAGATSSTNVERTYTYTATGDLTGEDFETVLPENVYGHVCADVTPSASMAGGMVSVEFVA